MANPTAGFLVIGDEILSGRTKDANVGYLAEHLTKAAIDLKEVRIVDDNHQNIMAAVRALSQRWDHVFTSGGIGPTHDDITADAIAAAFDTPIDVREDARALMAAHYQRAGVELNQARLRMARIPDGASLIVNPVSFAPGFSLKNVHVMAGVPSVFQAMVDMVVPELKGGQALISRTLRIDRAEGDIAGPLAKIASAHPEVSIGSYPFHRAGRFGSNVVCRSSDRPLLDRVMAELKSTFPEGQEQ